MRFSLEDNVLLQGKTLFHARIPMGVYNRRENSLACDIYKITLEDQNTIKLK